MKAIMERRSIRRFTEEGVTDPELERMLESAMAAPSARNLRPCHYIVLRDRSVLDRIPEIHPYAATASWAPLAIVICADTSAQPDPGYFAQDCSASTQNILLEATDMGLGSVWCGIFPRPERISGFTRLLELPEGIVPFSLVFIGHPAETKGPHEGIDRSRVRYEKW